MSDPKGVIADTEKGAAVRIAWFWPWLGGTFMFGLFSVMFNVIWSIVVASNVQLLLRHEGVTDTAVIVMLVLYAWIVGLIFAAYGALSARISSMHQLPLMLTGLLSLLCGLCLWIVGLQGSGGQPAEVWGGSWELFSLYHAWAAPGLEVLEPYTQHSEIWFLLTALLPIAGMVIGVGVDRYPAVTDKDGKVDHRWQWVVVSMSAALMIVLTVALRLPQHPYIAETDFPVVDGATAAIPFAQDMLHELTGMSKARAAHELRFNTTHQAYVNLIEKKADLILVAGPSDEELRLAKSRGVQMKLDPIGRDAFIFLVHQDNPVKGLSSEQVRRIYEGSIHNWSEVGGKDQPIIAYQREENSGSQTYMQKKVMAGHAMTEPPRELQIGIMGGMINAVADFNKDHNALGYSFYYFANVMHNRQEVKFLPIDGVEPNKEHIRSGQYPFTAQLFAITREGEKPRSSVQRLLEWLQSEDGTRAIERGGFVALDISTT
ncbi:PstS family phosphate ABC transporter substrate-binding protein [Paenibacillus sp. Aloe-11]|uniref:PstS family phosphate ABC transporter substrate-binding protein n=1 Tax=Paenibacillus sp. Aloe-11 TaxID=1050222 RepID=UPI00024EFAAC|nr:substrate-binding domain-containing protein [Paenibacillus sp. Aloe-11]EHS58843.1 phosphate ABC transporter periplasmic protein [Paenibacillus sp. Aloe-11]